MMLAVCAADLLVVFLALELAALPLYVLAAGEEGIARQWEGEAAAKFLHLGLLASALFLFGSALVYIGAGTTSLQGMASHWGGEGYAEVVLPGVALLIAGLLCKAAAVPFHAWSIDVREGVSASLAAFIGCAGMAAALAALARLLLIGLEPLREIWQPVLCFVAVLTILLTTLLALNQRSLKRLWAYLGIAHMGCALAALAAGRGEGLAVLLFGLVTASLSGVALFAGAALKEERGVAQPQLSAYRGLGRERPLLGALLAVSALSLAGLPPTAGFSARLYAVHALVDAELVWLAVVVAATLPLAFYACVRFIISIYTRRRGTSRHVELSAELLVVLLLAATVSIGAGLLPEVLMETARSAAVSLM
jgi:NADH-quinone oxidoreductase subunit N